MYTPKPIDTGDVILPDDLLALTEVIAENVHDVWAVGRLKEGWVLGEKRNDDMKTTPWLIPYDQLPESEREFDRNTAMESIKLILKLGYQIVKKENDPEQ